MDLPLGSHRWSSWRWPVTYLAPAILVVVASAQLYRAHAYRQSPWAGAGFGMFAVIDGHSQRFVRVVLLTPEGEEPIPPPPGVESEELAVRVVPSARNLAALARRTLAIVREERPEIRGVRIEAVGSGFGSDPPEARAVSLGEVRYTP